MSLLDFFITLSTYIKRHKLHLPKFLSDFFGYLTLKSLKICLSAIWLTYLDCSFRDLEMKKSSSLEKVYGSDLSNERNFCVHKSYDYNIVPRRRRYKSTYGHLFEEYSITIKPKIQRSSSLSDLTNSDYTLDFLKYTKHKTRRKAKISYYSGCSGDAVTQYVNHLTSPKLMTYNFREKTSKRQEMAQTYANKFATEYLSYPKESTDPNYSSGIDNTRSISSTCSTDQTSAPKVAAFPFKSTPSGNLKVQSNQVVFQSSTVGVLLADPTQAKVKVKFEGKASGEPDDDLSQSFDTELCIDAQNTYNIKEYHSNDRTKKSPGVREDKGKDLHSLGYAISEPIDWSRLQLPKKQDLFQEFYKRIHNYINTDTIVRIGDEEFHCHRIVLQIYSSFFDHNPMREIELPAATVTPEVFHTIYEWMIFGGMDCNRVIKRDNILSLFCAAQYLAIKDLEEQCWSLIVNENLFTEDTAFAVFREARQKELNLVMDLMTPRVTRFFLPLVASTDFLTLEPDEIMTFLKSNFISVTSEIEILMAAIRWLYADWSNRKEYAVEMMRCVRFGLISPWQLVDIKRNPDNAEILEVVNEPEIQQMVDDGLAYVIIKYWYGNNSQNYYHWLDVLGLNEPAERNWIGEEKNHVTYKDFLKYLEQFMVPKEQMYQQMNMMQSTRRTDDNLPSSMRAMDSDKMEMRRPKMEFPLPATLKGLSTLSSDKDKFPTMSDFFENKKKTQESNQCSPRPTTIDKEINIHPPLMERRKHVDGIQHMEEQNTFVEQQQSITQDRNRRHVHRTQICSLDRASSEVTKTNILEPPEKDSVDINNTTSETSSGTADTSMGEKNLYKPRVNERRHSVAASYLAAATAALAGSRRASTSPRIQTSAPTKLEPPSPPKPMMQSENNVFSPQISLFNQSKDSLARMNINKLSNSILGPSNKNYIAEGSLFNWDRETVLVFGGIDPHTPYGTCGNCGKDMFRFDPVTNVWDCVGELPEPRHHHSVAFLRGRVYLVGGADPRDDDVRGKSVVVSTVWSYEPVSRSWYSESGLAVPRKNFGLVVHRMALYAIGGQDKKGRVLRSVERFDPKSSSWSEVRSMGVARMAVACTKYREYIWVAGGMTGEKKKPVCKIVECYNSNTNEWTEIHNLRFPRCFATLFSMNDKLFIVGGAGKVSEKDKTASSVAAIDVWDWKAREWRQETEMSMPRHGHALAYLGTQLIIIGGVTTIYMRALNNVESYCCERGAWIRGVATLPLPLSGHGAVTLPPASLM